MQETLEFPEVYKAEETWPSVLEIVRQISVDVGRKTVADDLDLSRSVLDNILLDRDRHALKAKHLLYFLIKDRSGMLLQAMAGLVGAQVAPRKELSPEEKLDRLEKTLADALGKDLRESLYSKAWG